ncbi:MAG: alpha-L-arabinofuranosidase [Bryobacteraceae bacterium]|nr:alpha-L-arabinofuranosidase [Bryobacteraceae bacterium]
MERRAFLAGAGWMAAQARAAASGAAIVIDPKPLFDISPYLYMQFMEPLGTTDSSVEAAWDYNIDDWRADFVDVVKDLAPGMIRWGGLLSAYYKWREGVGPVEKRPWMRNYVWGGKETNRVGTREFVDLCRRTGAEPLYCVNFQGDGIPAFRVTREGSRWGDAREAADWVSYANDPDNRERRAHGQPEPYNLKIWQLGNETSYPRNGFSKEQAIALTTEFARAMKERDPSLSLIGWGDRRDQELWAGDLLRQAGEHLDYVAIHLMGQRPRRSDTALRGLEYQRNPEQAWDELLELSGNVDKRVSELEQVIAAERSPASIAVTEGHLSMSPHNSNPILYEWLPAVYHARSLNIYQRHGEKVKICTAADFEGNRWTVNAVMLQGKCYLMPVGSIMRLFKRRNGSQGVAAKSTPPALDVAASRAGDAFFLHVANIGYRTAVEATLGVEGRTVTGGRVFEIAPPDFRQYVNADQPDAFEPRESVLEGGPVFRWRFPAGSVSAVELQTSA